MKYKQKYIVTPDTDMMAPKWLSVRINNDTIRFIYEIVDGAAKLKGGENRS